MTLSWVEREDGPELCDAGREVGGLLRRRADVLAMSYSDRTGGWKFRQGFPTEAEARAGLEAAYRAREVKPRRARGERVGAERQLEAAR